MLSKKMEKAINEQINAELFSAYLYLSMSAYFESEGYEGMANWMRIQYQEEEVHAFRFFDYVNERGGRVVLKAIDAPAATWKSAEHVFSETLKHEQKVSGLINKLVKLARAEDDYATESFLRWYVDEQVEEEATAEGILQKVKMVGKTGNALYMLDKELGQRVFTPPTTTEA